MQYCQMFVSAPARGCNHYWIPREKPVGPFLGIKLLCSSCALFWLIDVIILALEAFTILLVGCTFNL